MKLGGPLETGDLPRWQRRKFHGCKCDYCTGVELEKRKARRAKGKAMVDKLKGGTGGSSKE